MATAKEFTTERIRNVAVLGHGGCGKTTLIDSLCFVAGTTKKHDDPASGQALTMHTPEEAAQVVEYARLGSEIKNLERTRKALGTNLLSALGADYGLDLGASAKLIAPQVKGRTTYDLKQIEKDHPGLLANYARQGEPTRQVRTYGLGDNEDE